MGKTYFAMKDYGNAEIQCRKVLTVPAKKQAEIKVCKVMKLAEVMK